MKRILLIEDSGDVSYDIKNDLKNYKYEIKFADSYLSAIGMWRMKHGLWRAAYTREKISKFYPTIGLSFLIDIKWDENLAKKIKLIIYSAYITEFKVKCSQNNIDYSGIVLVEKSGNNFYKLIDEINQL